MTTTAVPPAPAAAAAASTGTKVFCGNLSFKTREPDLAKFFEQVAPVKSTNIIARGPRSLGYGFVEFEHEEDALKAVAQLNKKVLDERPINIEVAKARDPNAPAPVRSVRPPRPSGFRGPHNAAPAGAPAMAAAPMGRRPRPPVQRRPRAPPTGAPEEPSKTTLFVANLPFVVDDEGLLEIFDGMKVKEAHVVRRSNGNSKGYGFVTFDTEADQKHAMDAIDKTLVENREISVRPAMTAFRPPQAGIPAPAAAEAPKTEAK